VIESRGVQGSVGFRDEPEVTHAALGARHEVVGDGRLQRSRLVVLDVEGQSALQELDGEVVLADGVQDEADVAVDLE
jgi:hypothetical protein